MTRTALLLRRPLALLFILGCAVSATASGRYSARLIIDGAISFAFIPMFEVAAFAVAWRRAGVDDDRTARRRPFAVALDGYLRGDWPWWLWLLAVSAVTTLVPERAVGSWIIPILVSMVVPAAWTAWIDRRFFSPSRGVLLTRAIAWPAATVYFLGIAIWADIVPLILRWLGL